MRYFKTIPFITLIGLSALISGADLWNNINGVPIRQGIFVEWQRTVCPAEFGNSIIIWSDTRYGSRNIFAQKISSDGSMLWGDTGATITDLPGRQEDPVAIEDGNGGAFICWVDYRYDEEGDIFYQHVDMDGSNLLDSSGVALCQQSGTQLTISMCTDSAGGVFVSWEDGRNGVDTDIYGTHIDASDNVVEAGDGVPINTFSGDQNSKSIEYAGSHHALIVWNDSRGGEDLDIYSQRLDSSMSSGFESDGLAIAVTTSLETKPRTTYVHGDSSIVVWQTGETTPKIMYQFVNGSGLLGSPTAICSDTASQMDARVKRNMNGQVAIIWKDLRYNSVDGDIYAQQIQPNGDLSWDTDGIRLDASVDKKGNSRLLEDSFGGILVTWERGTFPEVDIVTNYITSSGNLEMGDTGMLITSASGYQFSPILENSVTDSFFVVYANQGSGSIDLTVQSVDSNGNKIFDSTGVIIRNGLDGDVKYVYGLTDDDSLNITWEDNRAGRKIFGTRIKTGGYATQEDGIQLTTRPSISEDVVTEPVSVEGPDGIYIATFDASTGTKLIRLNKVSKQLVSEWPVDGILIHESTVNQRRPFLVPLDNGVAVFWSEIPQFDFDVKMQIFDSDGNATGPDGGMTLADTYFVDEYTEWATLAPNGNILIFWKEDPWGGGVFKYSEVTLDGQFANGWPPSGFTLAGPIGNPGKLQGKVVSQDQGVMLVWDETRENAKDVYAQMIDWNGNPQMDASGVPLTQAPNDQANPSFDINPGMGTALVVWEDFRDGVDFNLDGQLIDINSNSLIDTNKVICDAPYYQQNPYVKALDQFGYGIVWEDGRGSVVEDPILTGGLDIYMNGFSDHLLFDPNGTPVAQEYHNQKEPQITRLNSDEYLVSWLDLRSSGKADLVDLYATVLQRTDILTTHNDTPLPMEFKVYPAYPNPFNGAISIRFDIPELTPVHFTVFNLLGAQVYQSIVMPSQIGENLIHWNGNGTTGISLPSGLYFYRISMGDRSVSGKITYLK